MEDISVYEHPLPVKKLGFIVLAFFEQNNKGLKRALYYEGGYISSLSQAIKESGRMMVPYLESFDQ